MCRNLLLSILLGLGCGLLSGHGQGQESKRSIAAILKDLQKGEKEQLQALKELEALGENAVKKLGSSNFNEREKARQDLEAIGLPAHPNCDAHGPPGRGPFPRELGR